ncbi:proline rich transmembrane protein 1B-like [Amphiura filiformis]|uniref:proline rich transmembrane protein 1B-like n=1 Tax=Amphiura filiformis TaxID=82378 RepID=UPI003B223A18
MQNNDESITVPFLPHTIDAKTGTERPSTLSVYPMDQYDPGYDPGYDHGFEDAGYDHTVQPKDYWCMALNVTLFCCLPLGLLALVKSSDVRARFALGDSLGAHLASKSTKTFCYLGIVMGIIQYIVVAVLIGYYTLRIESTLATIRQQ